MRNLSLLLCLLAATCADVMVGHADDDLNWVRIRLDERFRSEGVAAGDFNGDGNTDVVAGDIWYEAPATGSDAWLDGAQWKLHEVRTPGEFVAGVGYSNSFCNLPSSIYNSCIIIWSSKSTINCNNSINIRST